MIDLLRYVNTNQDHLLDKGFLRVVDVMPRLVNQGETADQAVAQAARVSYQSGTKTARDDRGLIRYLMRHRHTSPFEMVELKFHAKLPIFVARQWVRHRTASINEVSARYSVLANEFYTPSPDNIKAQSTTNKQGSGGDLPDDIAERTESVLELAGDFAFREYEKLLGLGVARETARMVLPVSTYTEWYWKANLLNVFRFIALRADPHAQMEIRVYAEAMAHLVGQIAPNSFEAFNDYWLNSRTFSAKEWAAILDFIGPDRLGTIKHWAHCNLSPGEAREFIEKLGGVE